MLGNSGRQKLAFFNPLKSNAIIFSLEQNHTYLNLKMGNQVLEKENIEVNVQEILVAFLRYNIFELLMAMHLPKFIGLYTLK